ncbi:MAG: hypothetical protein E6G29_09625 [Actinobacteria bacterium]|nr:MAG: hypothetical protein E6G29_09625 [Actinomycetota bacterium]
MNARRKLMPAVVAVCALSLVASGCGGNSYKDNVKKAAAQFKKTSTDAGTKLQNAKSKTEFSAGVDEFQGAVRTFNSKLSSLKPPSGAQAAQSHLITVLNTFSSDAGAVRDALNAGNLQQVKSTALKVQTDVADVKSAAQALESAAK